MAILILSILAIAGAASMHLSRSATLAQRDRRTALEIANGRIEDTRVAAYGSISPLAQNYNIYYLSRTGANWRVTSADPGEKAVVNGRQRAMQTTVQYVDIDGGSSSYDVLRLMVSVRYHANTSSVVALETLRAR